MRYRLDAVGLHGLSLMLMVMVLTAGSALAQVQHVIHISVDGLRSLPAREGDEGQYLPELVEAGKLPTFARLAKEGAWTHNARTDFNRSETLPNHASMITSRPSVQPKGMPNTTQHQWTNNSDVPVTVTIHNNHPHVEYVASVFDVVHDAGKSTALYNGKGKFLIFDRSYDEIYGQPHEHGRDKIDSYVLKGDSAQLTSSMLEELAERKFGYVFLHYRGPDGAGHSKGWGSPAWQQSVIDVDTLIGKILEKIENDPQFKGRTALIITADHGGTGTGHGESNKVECYTIPVYVWGPGVAAGSDLYELNKDVRTDPGVGRPDYTIASPGQPIRNGDTGNLALSLLGLGPIPGSFINADQSLRVAPVEAAVIAAEADVEVEAAVEVE